MVKLADEAAVDPTNKKRRKSGHGCSGCASQIRPSKPRFGAGEPISSALTPVQITAFHVEAPHRRMSCSAGGHFDGQDDHGVARFGVGDALDGDGTAPDGSGGPGHQNLDLRHRTRHRISAVGLSDEKGCGRRPPVPPRQLPTRNNHFSGAGLGGIQWRWARSSERPEAPSVERPYAGSVCGDSQGPLLDSTNCARATASH